MKQQPHVPDWLLERLAAGELPELRVRELSERLDAAGERSRLAALADSNAEILRAHPPALVLAAVRQRAVQPAARRPAGPLAALALWPLLAFGGPAALVLALALDTFPGRAPLTPPPAPEAAPEGLIAKGLEPYLSIYRRTAASPERLPERARVRTGDTLQLAYVAAGQRFGVVASVDGRGAVTLHLPEAAGRAAALDDRGETPLPHAYELDETPGNERFVFVTAAAPFDTAAVVAHLEGKAQRLPAGLALRSIELEKSTP
jgi:hypothetical protein